MSLQRANRNIIARIPTKDILPLFQAASDSYTTGLPMSSDYVYRFKLRVDDYDPLDMFIRLQEVVKLKVFTLSQRTILNTSFQDPEHSKIEFLITKDITIIISR